MALMPKRVKFRKSQRGRCRGLAQRGNTLAFGDYGLKSLERGVIRGTQIEAARVALSRHLGTAGKYWIRVFPHKSYSGKPAETRMGKGKGDVAYWGCPVKPGMVLFELAGVDEAVAREALRLQASKLPLRTRMIRRTIA
jgi:large subunit ribosomal protein L16